jgi:predicted PurR-regulated permease PerM
VSVPAPVERERVRVSTRSIVQGVAMTVAALAVFAALSRASRVVTWVLTAVVLAGLLEPAVAFLASRLRRRGFAVAAVALAGLAAVVMVAYGIADGVRRGTDVLRGTVQQEVAQLERSERFGDLAKEAELATRARRLVDQVPLQLFGQATPQGAVRAAVDRVVSMLVVTILTLFLLLRGPVIPRLAARLPMEESRRHLVGRSIVAARARGLGYVRRTMLLASASGAVAFLVARLAEVPGAAPLGVWAALWDLVPVVGAVIGFLPVVALALVGSSSTGALVAAAFVVYEVVETTVRRRWVSRGTMHLGPFLTAVALIGGMELAGVLGALMALAVTAFAVSLADELVPAWRRG